jgi:hypothetical protein
MTDITKLIQEAKNKTEVPTSNDDMLNNDEPENTTDVKEGFKANKKIPFGQGILGIAICLLVCTLNILYVVYLFIFSTECIIRRGQKDGKILWGFVIGQMLLWSLCGPCMFIYRWLVDRCRPENYNTRRNNTRANNTRANNTRANNTRTNNTNSNKIF